MMVAMKMEQGSSLPRRASVGISFTVLVVAKDFGPRLKANAVTAAIAEGIVERGVLAADLYPIEGRKPDAELDARMRAARAVVIAAPRLDESTLLGSLPFEVATRARQAGVPCYAVTRENALTPFDARILDLQVVIQARSRPALRDAGARLAALV